MVWWERAPFSETCGGVYFIFVIVLILIFGYALILRLSGRGENRIHTDPLNQRVMDLPGIGPLSWWPLTHYFLFLILGILFPHCDLLVIGAGILWEVFEVLLSIVTANTNAYQVVKNGDNIEYSYSWWSGSYKDILMNIAGFYTGKAYRLWFEATFSKKMPCCVPNRI